MHLRREDIENMSRIERLRTINKIGGVKPANLIGTADAAGRTNLAIFNSVMHIGSDPALVGFIARPRTAEVGHTFRNIMLNGYFTINHVHPEFVENAHYTSAKFEADISEFSRCGLTEEYIPGFQAPFVKESRIKMGLAFSTAIDIPLNGTTLVIGEIQHLIIDESAIVNGEIDLEAADSVGVGGLNTYYTLQRNKEYPYARAADTPNFRTETKSGGNFNNNMDSDLQWIFGRN